MFKHLLMKKLNVSGGPQSRLQRASSRRSGQSLKKCQSLKILEISKVNKENLIKELSIIVIKGVAPHLFTHHCQSPECIVMVLNGYDKEIVFALDQEAAHAILDREPSYALLDQEASFALLNQEASFALLDQEASLALLDQEAIFALLDQEASFALLDQEASLDLLDQEVVHEQGVYLEPLEPVHGQVTDTANTVYSLSPPIIGPNLKFLLLSRGPSYPKVPNVPLPHCAKDPTVTHLSKTLMIICPGLDIMMILNTVSIYVY